jgi:hypothetical protein
MSTSAAFDRVAGRLSEWTPLDALAARGTVRILLKEAGLDAASVAPQQMATAARKLLPEALRSRGVADADGVTARIVADLASVTDDMAGKDTPERVFERLGARA